MISAEQVVAIHEAILKDEPGLHGRTDIAALEGAMARVENLKQYEGVDDVFEHAALYAIALARGHVFSDANKRTALVTCLTYLEIQGFPLKRSQTLEDIMVEVAEGNIERSDLADILYSLVSE
ncbi:type II toxin-antitoxin system death-on-curing family toxin (plasmid) [Chromobacterium amazonense]|uniref:type II toxin-antitoxin system death-on-curing family toxin n=1 Tax=Chromobacterium amazonense TaxID=1382803 RepID=UPI00237E22F2|nr:type II toxin-antitoxin system death-on-curing family toxin [Chromobacterium amazonense]MDE1714943.1 type II toxin-antitoxin system death-on-curing family toxin [Chromobacterium amazonense]